MNALPGDTYRWNWNTPILLSPHNPRTIWMGGNRLFRSDNQGDLWIASADLTRQVDRCKITVMGAAGTTAQLSKNDGMTSFSTVIAISESQAMAGVVWAGTDDGLVQVSRDNGATFTEVGKNITGLPAGALDGDNPYWISRIDASHFDAATAYVAIDGHRSNDLKPYVYATHDYGRTWSLITNGLPTYGNVQVVREDPKNRDLLYAGTEFGLFVSLDGGRNWERFMNNYPTVRTDDILIHPRDNDLIVGTHGRSIYIMDDVSSLQQLSDTTTTTDAALLDIRPAVAWTTDIQKAILAEGAKVFRAQNPAQGSAISYWLKSAATSDVRITVTDVTGREIRNLIGTKNAGLNRVQWDLRAGGAGGRGRGQGGGGAAQPAPAAEAGAPATPQAGAQPPSPQQPAAPATPDEGARGRGAAAAPAATPAGGGGGGGGRGRGAFGGPPVAAGTYLVKLMIGDKVVGQKTIVVEPDSTFLQ